MKIKKEAIPNGIDEIYFCFSIIKEIVIKNPHIKIVIAKKVYPNA